MCLVEERLHYGQFVTPKLTRKAPIYDWYTFPHSFAKELVHQLLDEFDATPDTIIFDPFVGAGTTLLACRERGIPAFGIDQLPFSVFTSNVKIRNYNPGSLQTTFNTFKPLESIRQTFGKIPIIDKAFSDEAKKNILAIYGWTQTLPKKQADFFLLALLSILEKISQAVKSGGWLRIVENQVGPDDIEGLFRKQAQKMIDDIQGLNLPVVRQDIVEKNSPLTKQSTVITSKKSRQGARF